MTPQARTALAAAALATLYTLSARAQFSYKTNVDVAGFALTVVDKAGETVADLKADDFDVREDGVPQSVTYFATGSGEDTVPLHIGLLFDTSESMDRDLAFSRNAAIKFLKTFAKAVDFTVVEFADDVRAARFSQAEFPRLVERIRSSKAKGRTSLYDAVTVFLGSAYDQTGRKVLGDLYRRRRYVELAPLGRNGAAAACVRRDRLPDGVSVEPRLGTPGAAVEAPRDCAADRRAGGLSRHDEGPRPDVRVNRRGNPGAISARLRTDQHDA
jgi:hypothetical protein